MSARIYVGNIPYTCTEQDLRSVFGSHGQVLQVTIVSDRDTSRPRGFAFVEMDDNGARTAIAQLDGTDLGGRRMSVGAARERSPRPREDRRVDRDSKREWA